MPDPSRPDDPKMIGDASSLFDTDELRPIQVSQPPAPTVSGPVSPAPYDTDELRPIQAPQPPAPTPRVSSSPAPDLGGYDLEGVSFPEVEEPPRPVPIPSPPVDRPRPLAKAKSKTKADITPAEESGSAEFATEFSDVDPVWSRGGEWGPDAIRLAGTAMGSLFLTWLTWNWGFFGTMVMLAGLVATVAMSYPLLITLERPVRITPEHAVTDFYEAASHHFPSYRRMWLLLSDLGRDSGDFSTFDEFRDYWQSRIDRWRRAKAVGKYTPLKFVVEGFRADKSTGKETSRAGYAVQVYVRGREDEEPIETIKMAHGLVKGPDRMWYLNKGVLDTD